MYSKQSLNYVLRPIIRAARIGFTAYLSGFQRILYIIFPAFSSG